VGKAARLRLLLDTHAIVWWFGGDSRLSSRARSTIAAEETIVHVSAVSSYEIAFKHGRGRLPEADGWVADYEHTVQKVGFLELAVTTAHALAAGRLAFDHGDPWDRLLVAQALAEDLTLVSNEEPFDVTGVRRLW
jgi:PIN domain nuclease of toxin-antitoxin system